LEHTKAHGTKSVPWLPAANARRGNVLAIVGFPIVALLYVLNLARFFWADLGYGIAVGILAPLAIFRALV